MKRLSFKVAPYALQDTLEALSNTHDSEGFYNELIVTKEDGHLVVLCTKVYTKRMSEATVGVKIPSDVEKVEMVVEIPND